MSSRDPDYLAPLLVSEERAEILAAVGRHFQLVPEGIGLVARAGFVAIPLESGAHLAKEDVARLLGLTRSRDDHIYVVEFADPLGSRPVYRMPTVPEAFDELNLAWSMTDVVLVPRDARWLMLCSEDDFIIVVGDPGTVQQLSGVAPKDAASSFRASIRETWLTEPPPAIKHVADAPWDQFGSLREGEMLLIKTIRD